MTQVELGEKVGVSGVAITRYEKGTRKLRIEQLEAIADALGVSVGFLIGYETENAGISAHTPQALVLAAMAMLNYDGQQKVVERAEELMEIPRYQAAKASPASEASPVSENPAKGLILVVHQVRN